MRVFIELSNGNTVVMRTIGDADVNEAIEKWKQVNIGQYVSHRIPEDDEANPVNPTPVPTSITRAQAKKVLLYAGFLDLVQPAIDAIADPVQRMSAQIDWDDSGTFERSNGTLVAMAAVLGLTHAQIDQLFIDGSTL